MTAPRSLAAVVAEREVLITLKEILEADGHHGAEIILSTVRVLAKGVLECCFHIGPRCWTAEICCVARKVLHLEEGMPAEIKP